MSRRNDYVRVRGIKGQLDIYSKGSLRPRPDHNYCDARKRTSEISLALTPLSDLDLMILNGWGDTPQNKLPDDWRTRRKGTQ